MSKTTCVLGKRARVSHEWNDGSKDRIYCYGYKDPVTDNLLTECFCCLDNVNKAQDDLDAWNKAKLASEVEK